jgi:hypothetical protein
LSAYLDDSPSSASVAWAAQSQTCIALFPQMPPLAVNRDSSSFRAPNASMLLQQSSGWSATAHSSVVVQLRAYVFVAPASVLSEGNP